VAAEAIVTFLLIVITAVAVDTTSPPARRHSHRLGTGRRHPHQRARQRGRSQSGPGDRPMILTGRFTDWWAYLTAPVAAGILAVLVYNQVLREHPGTQASPARR